MKKAAYLLMLLGLLNCQRGKDAIPKAFQILEGKWEQTGHQTGPNEWVRDSTNGEVSLIFRADGVPLYGEGFWLLLSAAKTFNQWQVDSY